MDSIKNKYDRKYVSYLYFYRAMFGSKQFGYSPKQKPKALKLDPVLACKPFTAAAVNSFIL